MALTNHHILYASLNVIMSFSRFFAFGELTMPLHEPVNSEISLDDTYVYPGLMEFGDNSMDMKLTIGVGYAF